MTGAARRWAIGAGERTEVIRGRAPAQAAQAAVGKVSQRWRVHSQAGGVLAE